MAAQRGHAPVEPREDLWGDKKVSGITGFAVREYVEPEGKP